MILDLILPQRNRSVALFRSYSQIGEPFRGTGSRIRYVSISIVWMKTWKLALSLLECPACLHLVHPSALLTRFQFHFCPFNNE